MKRTIARLCAATFLAALLAGCLISGPEPVPEFLSKVRIQPDQNLEAAPEGSIYELWTFDLQAGNLPDPTTFQSLVRFDWDPVNFRALNENGEPFELYSPTGTGYDTGVDLTNASFLLVTIEPRVDMNPDIPDGPAIMFYLDLSQFGAPTSPLRVNKSATLSLYDPLTGIQPTSGDASFSLVAQTVQYQKTLNGEEVCWRDGSQGMGLWFCEPVVRDLVTEDTAGFNVFDPENPDTVINDTTYRYRGTLFTRDVDRNLDGIPYQVWIFPKQPELSWSNFDLNDPLFRFTTPDLVFRDSVAIHPHPLDNGPPETGINAQGSNPIVRDGDTIGFMYFNPQDLTDTCFLRVDHPESTYCQSESEELKFSEFSDTNLIIRQYTDSWADTTITPSLENLPQVWSLQTGFAFEAWVVFDSANNPDHPPLSLGQMDSVAIETNFVVIDGDLFPIPEPVFLTKRVPDDSAIYYDPAMADPNFHFPGEDFLDMGQRSDLPSPLDLLNFPEAQRIKVWITLEPVSYDPEPTKPFAQLLTYVGEVLPEDPGDLQDALEACALRGDTAAASTTPPVLNYPLEYRPLSTSRSDLAEGHNWPSMKIFLYNPFVEE